MVLSSFCFCCHLGYFLGSTPRDAANNVLPSFCKALGDSLKNVISVRFHHLFHASKNYSVHHLYFGDRTCLCILLSWCHFLVNLLYCLCSHFYKSIVKQLKLIFIQGYLESVICLQDMALCGKPVVPHCPALHFGLQL